MNLNEPPSLLRNDLKAGGRRQLAQGEVDRNEIEPQRDRLAGDRPLRRQHPGAGGAGQSSFYSSGDRRLHFGLGPAKTADLTVRWTNGLVEKVSSVEANHMVTIHEGSGIVKSEKWK